MRAVPITEPSLSTFNTGKMSKWVSRGVPEEMQWKMRSAMRVNGLRNSAVTELHNVLRQ